MGNEASQEDPRDRRVTFADDDYDDYNRQRRYPEDDDRHPRRDDHQAQRRYPDDRRPDPHDDPRYRQHPDPYDRLPRRSPSLDSYDRGSPTGATPREGTGTSLGQKIRYRARQNNESTSPPPRLPSPPTIRRSPPPSPPRFDRTPTPPRRRTPTPPSRTPTPPRQARPPTRAVPVTTPRRPKPDPYVPTVIESPRQEPARYRRQTPPMTPINEQSRNGYDGSDRSRTPTPEHSPPRPKSRWSPGREEEQPVHTQPQQRRVYRRVPAAEKPDMSPDLWGVVEEPHPHEEPGVIYQYHDPHHAPHYDPHAQPPRQPYNQWATVRQQVHDPHHGQVIVQHHPQRYHRPKPKPKKPPVPQTTVQDKRRFQQKNAFGSFYGGPTAQYPRGVPARAQSLRDDNSVTTDPGSIASEGGRWRRRVQKATKAATLNPDTGEVNAYHLLGHGTGPTHSYFSQNVAVTVIKSPRRQRKATGPPMQQQQQQQQQQHQPREQQQQQQQQQQEYEPHHHQHQHQHQHQQYRHPDEQLQEIDSDRE